MVLHVLPLLDQTPFHRSSGTPHTHTSNHSLDGYVLNDRFLFQEKIGAGTFGLIYLVRDLKKGATYAAKIILTEFANSSKPRTVDLKVLVQRRIHRYFSEMKPLRAQELSLEAVQKEGRNIPAVKEISLHLTVHNHPNIATIHHVLLLENLAVITLMDFFPQGDLFGNIIDRKVFSCPPIHQNKQLLMKNCMLQLIDVVAYCASKNVYHCDLKPENIMVSYNPNYKRDPHSRYIVDYREFQIFIIDFGLAMSSDLICCNVCRGSSFYMAPERVVNYNTCNLVKSLVNMEEFHTDPYSDTESTRKLFPTLAGDIWSLGVLFINITCSKNPWPIANINDRQDVFYNYILNDSSVLRKILPISQQYNHILNGIFELNPNRRVELNTLAHMVTTCDFFTDASKNSQLLTPPKEFHSLCTTPVSSYTEMDQCQLSPFDRPGHNKRT